MSSKNVFETGSRFNAYSFDTNDIAIKPELNGRHELPSEEFFEWLIGDIAAKGQLEPGVVRKDGKQVVLSAGFTRLRAIKEANRRGLTPKPLKFLAVYRQGNEREGFLDGLSENLLRCQLTDLDKAYAIVKCKQTWQMSYEEIAPRIFPGTSNGSLKSAIAKVKRLEKLANLSPEAERAIKDGTLKPTAAAHYAELEADRQRTLLDKGIVTSAAIAEAEGRPQKMTVAAARKRIQEFAVGKGLPKGLMIPPELRDCLERLANQLK